MCIRVWNVECLCLAAAALLLASCESRPVAGPLPVRVAQTASAPTQPPTQASPTAAPYSLPVADSSSTTVPTKSGFSLPIGTDVPPEATQNSESRAALNVPPLSQQSQQQDPPAPATPPAAPPATTEGTSIHLSAGVAVPQSLPIGTVMAMSVDYSLRGRLNSSARYAWVIKYAGGEVVNEVKLENSGNLSAFIEQLKPEHRPFSARIEEITPGSNRRSIVSNEVPLKTSY
jgi:hypothetical protein